MIKKLFKNWGFITKCYSTNIFKNIKLKDYSNKILEKDISFEDPFSKDYKPLDIENEKKNTFKEEEKIQFESFDEYMNSFFDSRKNNELSKATLFISYCIKLKPENSELYFYRGELYIQKGEHSLAEKDFLKSLELNSKNDGNYYYLAYLKQTESKLEEAIELYQKVLDKNIFINNEFMKMTLNNLSYLYRKKGDFKKAKDYLNIVFKEFQNLSIEYYNRGVTLFELNEYKESAEDLQNYLKINPNSINTKIILSECLQKSKEDIKAIELINETLEEVNKDIIDNSDKALLKKRKTTLSKLYFIKGEANLSLNNLEEAIKDFALCYKNDRKNTLGLYEQAKINFSLDRFEEVIFNTTSILNIEPSAAEAYFMRSQAFFNLKKFNEAIFDFKICLEYFNNDVFKDTLVIIHEQMVFIYTKQKQHDNALKSLEFLLNISKNTEYLIKRLKIYVEQNNFELALLDLEDIFKLNNDRKFYNYVLYKIYSKKGDFVKAKKHLREYLKTDSKWKNFLIDLRLLFKFRNK
jgi:tetratricopeptide (TPR) repeat protein